MYTGGRHVNKGVLTPTPSHQSNSNGYKCKLRIRDHPFITYTLGEVGFYEILTTGAYGGGGLGRLCMYAV